MDVVIGVRKHADQCSALSARESLIAGGKSKMGDARESASDIGSEEALDQLLIDASQRWMV